MVRSWGRSGWSAPSSPWMPPNTDARRMDEGDRTGGVRLARHPRAQRHRETDPRRRSSARSHPRGVSESVGLALHEGYAVDRAAPGRWRKPKNKVLRSDIAGAVEAVGKDVTLFRPGDEVFG